jgi:hypothetical protein
MTMVKIDKKRKYFLMAMAFLLVLGCVYRMWPEIQEIQGPDGDIEVRKNSLSSTNGCFRAAGIWKRRSLFKGNRLSRGVRALDRQDPRFGCCGYSESHT